MYTLYIFIQNVEYKFIAPLQTSAHFHKQDAFHRLVETFFRDTTVFHSFHQPIVSLLHVFVFVAYEQDIAAGEDGLHRHIAEGVMLREGAHVHIVRYDYAVIAHILAQPVCNDRFRQARWMVRIA